jgi:hypothetical protein
VLLIYSTVRLKSLNVLLSFVQADMLSFVSHASVHF